MPSASTLCVVNLTATEAKVELLTSEFVQLRPDPTQGGLGADDAQDDYFMYDDDDNYQYEVTSAATERQCCCWTLTCAKAFSHRQLTTASMLPGD